MNGKTESNGTIETIFEQLALRFDAAPSMDTVKLWLIASGFMQKEDIDDLLRTPLKYKEQRGNWGSIDWYFIIASKYLKLVATEVSYWYYSEIKGEKENEFKVGNISATVSVLVSDYESTLLDLIQEHTDLPLIKSGVVNFLELFVGILLLYQGTNRPAKMLVTILSGILESNENNHQVPTLLNYYYPREKFQLNRDMDSRVAFLGKALLERGYDIQVQLLRSELTAAIEEEVKTEEWADTSTETDEYGKEWVPAPLVVCLRHLKQLTRLRVIFNSPFDTTMKTETYREESSSHVRRVIVKEAIRFRDENTTKKKKKKEKVPQRRDLSHEDVGLIRNTIKKVLRLNDPYAGVFREERVLDLIISDQNEGWIPLQRVQEFVESKLEGRNFLEGTTGVVEMVLKAHDLMNRFEVGVCESKESPFFKQRCARALYAHSLTDCTLYRTVLSKPSYEVKYVDGDSLKTLPEFLWLHLDKVRIEALLDTKKVHRHHHHQLFSIPFAQAMGSDVVSECWHYKRTEQEPLDEKIGKPSVFFAELNLHTILRDPNINVYKRSSWNYNFEFWYIFPQYSLKDDALLVDEEESSESNKDKVLPYQYFTGRFAVLGSEEKITKTIANVFQVSDENTVECILNAVDESQIGKRGTSTEFSRKSEEAEMEDEIVSSIPCGLRTFYGFKSAESEEAGGKKPIETNTGEKTAAPTVSTLQLDGIMNTINSFLDTSENCCHINIPYQDENGNYFSNRTKAMKELRAWISENGLMMRKESGSKFSSLSQYEIWRKSSWSKDELLVVVDELGVPELGQHIEFLREAVTRACEDSNNNYEIMEILGDAMLDYVVVTDTFLVKFIFGHSIIKKGVTSFLLRNSVIGLLLPPSVDGHLQRMYGDSLNEKVRGDIFEAIIGAAYLSKVGLDNIRKLLYYRFITLAEKKDSPTILQAKESCPYILVGVSDIEQYHVYRCIEVVDLPLRAMFLPSSDQPKSRNSHMAAVGLPRIQAKQYATYFTTGAAYSYRRVQYVDSVVMHNRVLSAYKKEEVAFVNEAIQPRTHLVIDFDGADIQSFGVVDLFCEWYKERFKRTAAMFIVDSTGLSVVTKRMKHSCHVHFPQVTLDLKTLEELQKDIRAFIVKKMQQLYGSFQQIAQKNTGAKGYVPRENILLYPRYLISGLSRRGWSPKRGLWGFCSAEDLLTVRKTCWSWRRSVDEHVAALCLHEPLALAKLFQVPSHNIFLGPDSESNPSGWVILQAQGETFLLPDHWCSPVHPNTRLLGVRIEFHDGQTDEGHVYNAKKWETVIDNSLTQSKKLRLYLCDKFDTVYGVEKRILYLDQLVFPSFPHQPVRRTRTQRPDNKHPKTGEILAHKAAAVSTLVKKTVTTPYGEVDCPDYSLKEGIQVAEEEEEEYPVVVAHRSTLRLTSLRTPEFRDVSEKLYYGWSASGSKGEERYPAPVAEVSDRLPSFKEVASGRADSRYYLESEDVSLWSSCMLLQPAGLEVTEKAKAMALLPSWWTYSGTRREAIYYIAGEKVIKVKNCDNLYDGIGAKGGLQQLVHLLTPHITFRTMTVQPEWCQAYKAELLPLFVPIRKKVDPKIHSRSMNKSSSAQFSSPTSSTGGSQTLAMHCFPTENEPSHWIEVLPRFLLSNPMAMRSLILYYYSGGEKENWFHEYDCVFELRYFATAFSRSTNTASVRFSLIFVFNLSADDEDCFSICQKIFPELKFLCGGVYFSSKGVYRRMTELLL